MNEDWNRKVAFMREAGAVSASWDAEGTLLAIALGPPPPRPVKMSADSTPIDERAERYRVATLAGARLRPNQT